MHSYTRIRHSLNKQASVTNGGLFCKVLAAFLVSALLLAIFASADAVPVFPLTFTLLAINGVLSIYGQLEAIRALSPLHYISFLFCYLFMSLMPILQIGYKIDPVFNFHEVVLLTSVAGLIFTLFGFVSIRDLKNKVPVIRELVTHETASAEERPNYILLAGLVLAFSLATALIFHRSLFTSRDAFGYAVAGAFGDKTTGGALAGFLMQTPFFGAAMGLRTSLLKRDKFWIATFSVLLLVSLVINNPLITSRFKLAGLIFFFVDYFFRGKRIKLLIGVLVLGISLAPMFQIFRYEGTTYRDTTYGDKYISTDYDAFQMICYTFLTVDRNGVSWGSNLVGAVLFWVPRSMWREKPEPSSFEIYYTAHRYKEVGTNNLSVPLMIEGYYAFSWVGLCLISMVYWWGITRLYLRSLRSSDSLVFVLRCVVTGVVLIVLRGPLVIGSTALIGNFAAALLAWRVFREWKPRLVRGTRKLGLSRMGRLARAVPQGLES